MPSTTNNERKFAIEEFQLIAPTPQPVRGKPFQLSSCAGDLIVFPHGKSVFLYNLKEPNFTKEFREHAYPVCVAKLSPSGALVASGDECGIVRIWSVKDLSRTIIETKMLGGSVNDLCWSEDEKYLSAAGDGRDKFAHVIKIDADGGSNFGELVGPGKCCASVALKGKFCLVGSDDKSVTVFKASPTFKFFKTLRDHDNFVQVIRFNFEGNLFASAGSDGKVFVYSTEGEELNIVCGGKWHESGILAMEWIDNETLITGSADGKLKIWTISSGQLRTEAIIDAQISGISVIKSLSGETSILVLRVDGKFEVFDAKMMKPQHEMKIVLGHGKGVVDLVTMADSFTTVSYDGKANQWKFENERISKLDSFDFPCKHVDGLLDSQTALSDGKNISRLGVVESKEGRIVASNDDQVLYEDGSLVCRGDGSVISISQDAIIECAALSQKNLLSVMFEGSKSLEIYKISSSSVEKVANFPDVPSRITRMSFGGSGEKVFLVTSDDQRRIKVYKANGSEWIREKSQWCSHSARIDTLVVDDKENIFSAGVDGHIMAWNLQHCPFEPLYTVLKAHSGPIAKLLLLPASQDGKVVLVSGASDSCIKLWNLKVNE